MKQLIRLLGLLAVFTSPAVAQDLALTGTLAKIHDTGTITLGVRASALPFSYRLRNGKPAGYAVDLCHELIGDISAKLGGMTIAVNYRTVTPETRIGMVVSGDIDLECGSTTRTEQRREQVAFSPVFYVAGTKLMVSRMSAIQSYRDLNGRTVVVSAGTTNEAAIHVLVDRLLMHVKIITAPDHAQSFALLREGKADAFATDDVLLAGMAATREGTDYHMVGEHLSYEPYGLMYRKDDPALAAVIEQDFRHMAESRRLAQLYHRWLMEPLPGGEMLNIPMAPELTEIFRTLGQPD